MTHTGGPWTFVWSGGRLAEVFHAEPDMLRLLESFAVERALLDALLRNHERIERVFGEWQAGQPD